MPDSLTQRKPRRGPQPYPPEQLRTRRLNVYLTDCELAELERRSKKAGIRPPAYLREAALNRLPRTIPELNQAAWVELARSAANLNQIAHRLNVGEEVDLEEVREELAEFRMRLIGASRPSQEGP